MKKISEGISMEREQQTLEIERQFIRGEVIFTIYENEADLFAIVRVKIHDTNENYEEKEIVMQGHFAGLQAGVLYEFFGELYDHPNFGLQYKVHAYETYIPKTGDGLIQYLSSDLFPGVGKKTAESIVNLLGDNAIKEIIDNPNVLFNIPHMRKKTAQTLTEILKENQGFERVAVELTSYGSSLKRAQQLYAIYEEKTI